MALLRKILSFLSFRRVVTAETRYSSKDEARSTSVRALFSPIAENRRDTFSDGLLSRRRSSRSASEPGSRRSRFGELSEIWLYVTFKINSSASAEPGANGSTIPRINSKEARMRSRARARARSSRAKRRFHGERLAPRRAAPRVYYRTESGRRRGTQFPERISAAYYNIRAVIIYFSYWR